MVSFTYFNIYRKFTYFVMNHLMLKYLKWHIKNTLYLYACFRRMIFLLIKTLFAMSCCDLFKQAKLFGTQVLIFASWCGEHTICTTCVATESWLPCRTGKCSGQLICFECGRHLWWKGIISPCQNSGTQNRILVGMRKGLFLQEAWMWLSCVTSSSCTKAKLTTTRDLWMSNRLLRNSALMSSRLKGFCSFYHCLQRTAVNKKIIYEVFSLLHDRILFNKRLFC